VERTLVDELEAQIGARVRLQGWLHHQRQLSRVTFLLLRDRTGIAQVVVVDDAARAAVASLLPETVIDIDGLATSHAQAPGGVEVTEPTVSVISEPVTAPPFELRRAEIPAQLPTLLDHAAVALRHPHRRAVAAIGSASVAGVRSTSATESGANVFPIDWFGRPAFLAQSPQLYKQVMVGVFERVFEVAPVFRAEPHDTVRHLAEYVSLDVELGFISDHRDVMRVLRDVLDGMTAAITEHARRELALLDLHLPVVPDEIASINFVAAQDLIERDTGRPTVGEPDLAPADERWLGEWAAREHGSDFLFVTGYPMVKRRFYTHPDPARPEASNSFDLLFRGLELVTGGQRLHRYADYLDALAGRDLAPYEGYLEAFRHGMPPHGGFAIGLERWLARLTGAANVREVTTFPRDIHRLTP
jgi:nondiscriminating aspartyl-tRNA synthetase